jgi:hypothetical protein
MLPGKDQTVILHPVPVEEPDGYRGRRRRFFMTRKGGGVALPALLIAASVVVVLIVIGVAEMLPRGAVGQIPQGGGNGAVTDGGDGQPAPDTTQPGGSASGSARPSKSASASARPGPSPSGGVSSAPVVPGAPPPAPTTSAPPRRQAASVEAESAGLAGSATPAGCSGCSAGFKVRFIGNGGAVTVSVPGVPSAGNYPMTITYELGQPSRTFYVKVNGGAPSQVALTSNTTSWSTPLSVTVQIALGAGTNTIMFYNPTADAPDLDRVTV